MTGEQSGRGSGWILAIDQGTTGTTAVVMDPRGRSVSSGSAELAIQFPSSGWVEQRAEDIEASVAQAVQLALERAPTGAADALLGIGITNQRETTLLWERASGRVLHPAIVWQDRRTAGRCAELAGHAARVREVTGLVIDPYFSASKIQWLLEREPEWARRAASGELVAGTVDAFLVERLSGGQVGREQAAVIEVTNASRTLLMNVRSRTWSREMCRLWGIPEACLPRIIPSAGIVARTRRFPGLPDGVPIAGIAGDQHAALFGQGCVSVGEAKCTYGTGAFALVNTGERALFHDSGLLTTLAWQIGERPTYALEGASFIAGAAVQWLRDGLGLISSAPDIERLAASVDSSDGVVFVPALTGLGAPYWDPEARGVICGLSRGTSAGHIARATLEAIAYQVDDLLRMMQEALVRVDLGALTTLRVDGGASRNDLLMQFQADLSGLPVERPQDVESTARGAGLLAAVGLGLVPNLAEVGDAVQIAERFVSQRDEGFRAAARAAWEQGVRRTRSHV